MSLKFLIPLVTAAAEQAEEMALETLLGQLHSKNLTDYEATIEAGEAFISHLAPAAVNSKFFSAMLEGMTQAIDASKKEFPGDSALPDQPTA